MRHKSFFTFLLTFNIVDIRLLVMSERLKQNCYICKTERPLHELQEVILPDDNFGYVCPEHPGVDELVKGQK